MSGYLAEQVHLIEGIQLNTASKKVSRDQSIRKITGFFASGQSFCYLDEHIQERDFFKVLLSCFDKYGKKYWYCLNAVRMNGGIISRKYLECYTNYPVHPLKSHIPFKVVMQQFVKNGILIFQDDHYLIAPKFNQPYTGIFQSKTIESIQDAVLSDFDMLLKNIGLISYNTGETFVEFGKFKWCFKGVCPVHGLKVNGDFGFVLADIIFGQQIREDDIGFFLEKLKTIQSFKNASKTIPFLLVDDVDPSAMKLLKKSGIVIGFINELFGQKYADTLKDLVKVLQNAGASLKSDPTKYLDLLNELKKYNNGLANNIKGALFEFVIGHIHSIESNSSIDLGKEVMDEYGKHEIDVLAVYPHKIVFAECKATNSPTDLDKIEKWTGKKIPAFKNWAEKQENWKKKKLEFEYWSTNGFDKDAEEVLTNLKENAKRYQVSFYTGKDLRQRTIKMGDKKLKEALDTFFLKTDV